jgi:PEP-CTERM motif
MKIQNSSILWKNLLIAGLGLITISSFTAPARAALIYDESTDGDLDDSRFTPTVLPTLNSGSNTLRFSLSNPTPIVSSLNRDLDYFSISVPEGFQFTQLFITQYEPQLTEGVVGSDQIAFIGLQGGTIFTEPPQPSDPATGETGVITNPANLLGYTLIGSRDAADALSPGVVNAPFDDLLPPMGATVNRPNLPNGSTSPNPAGFASPLSAGNYVFWVQQTASGAATVELNFIISPIPEPTSALALFAVGGLGLALKRKQF